jgi:hypothetical protein
MREKHGVRESALYTICGAFTISAAQRPEEMREALTKSSGRQGEAIAKKFSDEHSKRHVFD